MKKWLIIGGIFIIAFIIILAASPLLKPSKTLAPNDSEKLIITNNSSSQILQTSEISAVANDTSFSELTRTDNVSSSELSSFDTFMDDLMKKWQIPGGSLAIAKDGKLIFAKGYGLASIAKNELVEPESLFRIASITKTITATAILKLSEEGKLDLDSKFLEVLDYKFNDGESLSDPKISEITIRQLLQHSGGWDRDNNFDPMFQSKMISEEMGLSGPADCEEIMRHMFTREKLDFEPGTKYVYSNFGYCILGRVIEKVSGESYEEYVRKNILQPMGISRMQLGHTLKSLPDEVEYYDYPGAVQVKSIFNDHLVSGPYGGFYLEAMDAHGGWVASTIDILRFVTAIDGSRQHFLGSRAMANMLSRPVYDENKQFYYGAGWDIRPIKNDANWWHAGSLPGTQTLVVRTYNSFVWVALFNSRPLEFNNFASELDDGLWEAYGKVRSFPEDDLFNNYS